VARSGKLRIEVLKSWMACALPPYARPAGGNVSRCSSGDDDARSPFSGMMSSAPPSSSDGGAVSFAGVENPAPPGAAPGAGEAAVSQV